MTGSRICISESTLGPVHGRRSTYETDLLLVCQRPVPILRKRFPPGCPRGYRSVADRSIRKPTPHGKVKGSNPFDSNLRKQVLLDFLPGGFCFCLASHTGQRQTIRIHSGGDWSFIDIRYEALCFLHGSETLKLVVTRSQCFSDVMPPS